MAAAGDRFAGLGLFRVERCPAQGQGLVYAQTADLFSRGRGGAAAAVVDSCGAASVAILRDDWAASRRTDTTRLGRRAGGDDTSLHRSRVARLFAGARKNAEHGQHRGAATGADHDRARLVADVLNGQDRAPALPLRCIEDIKGRASTASPSFLSGRPAFFEFK